MKYIVMEIQTFETGAVSTPTYAFDDRLSAEAKYHSILASAAVSALPNHACVLMTSEGRPITNQSYAHPVKTPEPAEEEPTNE